MKRNLPFYVIAPVVFLFVVLISYYHAQSTYWAKLPPEKVLTTLCPMPVRSFDPAQEKGIYAEHELAKIYEGLFEYHYLKSSYELAPNLATGLPIVSEDGLVYTISIRADVRFQDNPCFEKGTGRPLVAEDFVYSIKRLADPQLKSGYLNLMIDRIAGLGEWHQQALQGTANYDTAVAGLRALDPHTLQLTLKAPCAQFPYILAMSCCYVVPREAVERYQQDFARRPVGTGPFVLQRRSRRQIVYSRNPTFRDKYFPTEADAPYQHMLAYAGQKVPFVDKLVTHIVSEGQARWLKFKRGQADVMDLYNTHMPQELLNSPEADRHGLLANIQQLQVPDLSSWLLSFNNRHPLFQNNLKLRQALSYAFDHAQYNQRFHQGKATIAHALLPPGLEGYEPNYRSPYATYDLKKAQQLLIEVGHPSGEGLPALELDVNADTVSKEKGAFFQACMEKLGIKVKVQSHSFPELVKKVQSRQTMMNAGGWSADYPNAEAFLHLLYKSDQHLGGFGLNFNDSTYNMLYEQAAALPPSAARTKLYVELNKASAEHVPAIYTTHQQGTILYHPWVKNYRWSSFHHGTEQYMDTDRATPSKTVRKVH